jgi:hypothetical protein
LKSINFSYSNKIKFFVCFVSVDATGLAEEDDNVKVKFETLRAIDQADHLDMDHHMSDRVIIILFYL